MTHVKLDGPARRLSRPAALLTAVALLSLACATTPEQPAVSYDDLVATARDFADAGHTGAALEMYRRAAVADPARKEPWQRIASISLAAGQPGRALVAAEETLQRDPADAIANQVYVASAMQIAEQAMQRMLAASARPDAAELARAQQLVATMGLVFGDDALIRDEVKARLAKRAVQQYRAAQARRTQDRPSEEKRKPRPDPFDVLGGD